MPFDATPTTVLPLTSDERWSVNRNAVSQPFPGYMEIGDNAALYFVLMGVRHSWARRFNDGDNHCVVGWVARYCEPNTVIERYSEQSVRIMQRLHAALPRSARSRREPIQLTLARYNDTHTQRAMERVCTRAYEMLINETWGKDRNGIWPYPETAQWSKANG